MTKKWKVIYGFIVVVYLFVLLDILIFKYLDNPLQLITGNHPDYRGMNLILFKDIWNSNLSAIGNRTSIIWNMLLFVPISILYNIIVKEDWKKTLMLSFSLSVIVEICQYIFRIGALDVNDIFLNTLGGFLGIIIYRLIKILFSSKNVTRIIGILGGVTGILVVIFATLVRVYN